MKVVNLEKMLPGDLPDGEQVVWFGRPNAVSLWRRAYRADLVAVYFGVLTLWNFFSSAPGVEPIPALIKGLTTLGIGVAGLAILGGLAWLSARTTLYVVTTRRIVLKAGIALQIFHNVPYTKIATAALRTFGDGTGDVAFKLMPEQHIAYLTLWPSARPLHLRDPEPTLRCISNAREIAQKVTRAMVEASDGKGEALTTPAQKPHVFARPATA